MISFEIHALFSKIAPPTIDTWVKTHTWFCFISLKTICSEFLYYRNLLNVPFRMQDAPILLWYSILYCPSPSYFVSAKKYWLLISGWKHVLDFVWFPWKHSILNFYAIETPLMCLLECRMHPSYYDIQYCTNFYYREQTKL